LKVSIWAGQFSLIRVFLFIALVRDYDMILRSILFILIILSLFQSTYAQPQTVKNSFRKAKTTDNSGYILGINQGPIKWKDTTYYAQKLRSCRYARISVTLTNITADTLKYMDMSCSTLDIFTTDTKDARIIQDQWCYKNNLTTFKLAPYASVTFELPIWFSSTNTGARQILITKEFKIGMDIYKYEDNTSVPDYYDRTVRKDGKNLLWSEAIQVH